MNITKITFAFLTAAILVTVGACGNDNAPKSKLSPLTKPSASAAATVAPLTTHKIGEAFTVGTWQLTITGSVDDRTDTSAIDPVNVTAVQVSYANTGNAPAQFTVADVLGNGTLGNVYATDATGRQYAVAYTWMGGAVNPGVTGTNEFVFKTPKGLHLTLIVIGGKDAVVL